MAADKHFTVAQAESLQQLRDAIDMDRGYFSLIFAHCHYRFLRDRLIGELVATPDLNIEVIDLQPETKSLLEALALQYDGTWKYDGSNRYDGKKNRDDIDGILIRGFERVENLAALLTSINQVRESLKRDFPMPMVFWLTHDTFREVMTSAPDLESWSVGVDFAAEAEELSHFVQSTYETYLNNLEDRIPKRQPFTVELATLLRPELSLIQTNFVEQFEPDVTACFYTLFGITCQRIYQPELAIDHYTKALELYQELGDRFATGCVHYFLSRTYYSRAFSDREYVSYISPDRLKRLIEEQQQSDSFWQQGYGCITQAMATWRSCERENAITWAFPRWQRLLSYLEKWDELETYAKQSLALLEHQQSESSRKLFLKTQFWLGDALLFQGKNQQAKKYLETVVAELGDDNFTYALARQSLAEVYYKEHKLEEALALLNAAESSLDSESLSRAHVRLLEQKRQILFDLGQYLAAYKVREQKQLAEYEYSFKSFIGATRIQPRRNEAGMSAAIRASGRGKDVEKLVAWITGNEHAVTVIYGYSGVGKSSLVNAGLIPELAKSQRSAPNGYLQVLLRSYGDWQQNLLDELQGQVPIASLPKGGGEAGGIQNVTQPTENPPQPPFERGENLEEQIFALLEECDRRNQLVVLIFDQFEEFFFTYENEPERQQFFELLGRLTNETTRVNIVFSLRRDYLHFLLGRDQLKRGDKIIDLLSRENGYELRNFSRDEAIKVFQGLTARTSFQPEQELIEAVVDDLIDPTTERVRPIELQIVGRQLEETAGGITTFAAYQQQAIQQGVKAEQSPKAVLVRSYLDAVVKDCGTKANQRLAYQLMFLLTDKQGRRPIKSSEELEAGIRQLGQGTENVGMILQILVLSDLVSEVQDRDGEMAKYQLVHDYLVEYVREIEEQDFEVLFQAEVVKREAAEKSLKAIEAEVVEAEATKQDLERKNKRSAIILGFTSVAALVSVVIASIAGTQIADANRESIEAQEKATQAEAKAIDAEKKEQDALAQYASAQEQADNANRVADEAQEKSAEAVEKEKVANERASQAEKRIAAAEKRQAVADQKVAEAEKTLANAQKQLDTATVKTESAQARLKDAEIKLTEARTEQALTRKATVWERRGIFLFKKFDLTPTKRIETTLESIALAKELAPQIKKSPKDTEYAVYSPLSTLQQNLNRLHDKNILQGHTSSINDTNFSPDGQIIASASRDGTVRLWNPKGEELAILQGHTDSVNNVRFSPNGQIIASASRDGTVRLWNLKGEELVILQGHTSRVDGLRFSPDGQIIASASQDGTVRLWNLQGKKLGVFQGHTSNVYAVMFSPDGQTIASASGDNTVRLWNLQGQELDVFSDNTHWVDEVEYSYDGYLDWDNKVRFSPSGQTIASATQDNRIRLWNFDGEELAVLRGHTQRVYEMEFSPNGQIIASASWDNTARLWNLQGEELAVLQGHTDSVNNVRFSPDGQTLASVSRDGTVRLWNLQGEELALLQGHTDSVNDVKFSPDGQTLVSISRDRTVRLWNLQGQDVIFGNGSSIREIRFSPNGQTFISAYQNGMLQLWSVQEEKLTILRGHTSLVTNVRFSPDSQTIISASGDKTVRLWNLQGQELAVLQGHTDLVRDARFSPDGQIIASSSNDKTVKLWNLQGNKLATLQGHTDLIKDLRFSPDGRTIASAYDKTVRLWSLQGQELAILQGHISPVNEVVFSPDGQFVASEYKNGIVRLWNLQGQELATLQGHFHFWSESMFGFSPNGQILATAFKDLTVRLWNLQGEELAVLQGHNDFINDLVFSPNSQTLASASQDGTVRLWNLQGEELAVLQGHIDSVSQVKFSPDGQTLVSSSRDKTLRLWNLQGEELAVFHGHTHNINDVRFSPDGRTIASKSSDNTVRLWKVETLDEMIARGCRFLQDYLLYSRDAEDKEEYRQMCQEYFL